MHCTAKTTSGGDTDDSPHGFGTILSYRRSDSPCPRLPPGTRPLGYFSTRLTGSHCTIRFSR
ncbi:MAG: hypothetical protein Kow00109_12040 [Acidobacteriota bacterium]